MDMNPNRAGSLTLKSALPMEYSRSVLSNKWYLKRESEPRDFNLWSGNKPNLQQSTYKILAKQLDNESYATSNDTETKFKHQEALELKEEMAEADKIDTVNEMVDMENKGRLDANLDIYGNLKDSALIHKKGFNQHHLETTYKTDYEHSMPELVNHKCDKMIKKEFENLLDNSWSHRRQVSQFSDIDGPKRTGINTFHVQHGEYPNQIMNHKMHACQNNHIFEMKYFN